MQAICRVSALKALPNDEEIEEAGEADAATYLANLQVKDGCAYDELLRTRACAWGELPEQPPHRCVEHVVKIIIRRIEYSVGSGEGNARLSAHEVRTWVRKNIKVK